MLWLRFGIGAVVCTKHLSRLSRRAAVRSRGLEMHPCPRTGSRWYQERFGQGSSRIRRIGIVALARRLLVELWRYLETGALPEGAVLSA